MKVSLQYGTSGLEVDIPSPRVEVIEPAYVDGLADEQAGFLAAARHPIAPDGSRTGPPLRERIKANETVAIVIPDLTRPLPTDRLLRWLFAELAHVPAERCVIINGTGSHRANTREELVHMLGSEIVETVDGAAERAKTFFEKLWWHDQVVFDTSKGFTPSARKRKSN